MSIQPLPAEVKIALAGIIFAAGLTYVVVVSTPSVYISWVAFVANCHDRSGAACRPGDQNSKSSPNLIEPGIRTGGDNTVAPKRGTTFYISSPFVPSIVFSNG